MELEEFASLQLDKPLPDVRNEEQLRKHTLDVNLERRPIDRALHILLKGEEIQKLSVIQSLPSLLATDTQSCMSRVVPKMQQSLATASTEFHIAASSTFKTILEQKLVSHNVFSQTFLQSILNSLESRDPVICHAWLETLLDVIELLPVEVIRVQILPLTISKGQLSQPVYSRITCSRLLGKICTRFDSAMIQKEVLPTVHSLCQDVNSDVRANICLQLRFVAEGLGAESVKPALLPSLVELASDEESNVRYASVQTIVYLLPHLQEDTIKNIIAPLVKKLCENAAKSEDNVICIIAQELGKLVLGLEKCLTTSEKKWFLKYFQQLAQIGILLPKKEKPQFTFISSSPTQDERYVECRKHCAFNLPAMFIFISSSSEDVNALLTTFDALASDHYYMVRRTVACGIHEVAKVLGPKSAQQIRGNFIKLLKDDSEEVLQGLIPHIGLTLECLTENQTIRTDRVDSTLMEIGKALLKCEAKVAGTHNWRLASLMHAQLEILPKCFPSDFIYSYFVPMAFSRILHARPIPVRLAAGILFLVLLRYNMKSIQRAELRNRLITDLANNLDCYVRMMFVRMMIEALEIFSSVYFKEHFFNVVLSLAEDPVANIRMKVVSLLPQLKSQLWIPTDKKLLTSLESIVRHLVNNEKDRDVLFILKSVTQKLDEMDVKYEGQSLTTKLTKQDIEDAKRLEEEKKLSGVGVGKSTGTIVKKGWTRTGTDGSARGLQSKGERPLMNNEASYETKLLLMKYGAAPSRQTVESLKTSSMPEIPLMQSDDEFLVDAGIRIPTQFSTSPSASKIPHLQDFITTRRRSNNSTVRPRRGSVNFDKPQEPKFKRHSSVEYEDCMKRRTSENDDPSMRSTSIDYEEGLQQRNMLKKNLGSDRQLSKIKRYSAPYGRARFGWDAGQERSLDDKFKRNSLILDKDNLRFASSKCVLDRTKRHSTNFSLRLPDSTKETKQNFKRLSLEEQTTVRRVIKGYFSTLDVNHNQGLSKIPLRNVGSRSRTAPATRASSPVHVESRLRFDSIENCDDIPSSTTSDRHLSRFSSSDEEVDKLCRMLLHSQTENVMAQSSTSGTPRSRGRYPIHLLMKKL
ncbi:serine/threonine-protein phosphatase 4 regulatory subunit 4-like isoform X5 [Nylanderia fulva]|uniref:serine/threonine-protein phosphatase 4 regulatory subunit 4-like isoform X5 n=1 Tax=Nylanderia fulva TaxID=613905 RepID=UPI0010FB0A8C|nr:serine/threonine-protein phosphatase 4 regulatory subunit 4-like isoform X5 [Nylanderia fulva]